MSLVEEYDLQQVDDEQVFYSLLQIPVVFVQKEWVERRLRGILCPIPNLLESLLNKIAQREIVGMITNGIEKDGGTCKAYYKVQM
jgi:hypothetical protein